MTTHTHHSEAPAVERRAEPRRRVYRGATLTFNKGYGAFECSVRDSSPNGARLAFGETFAVPHRFDLSISGEAAARPARVCWRTETQLGVALD